MLRSDPCLRNIYLLQLCDHSDCQCMVPCIILYSVSVHSAMLYRLPESNVRKSTCLEASLEEHKSAVIHGWLDMHRCDG